MVISLANLKADIKASEREIPVPEGTDLQESCRLNHALWRRADR